MKPAVAAFVFAPFVALWIGVVAATPARAAGANEWQAALRLGIGRLNAVGNPWAPSAGVDVEYGLDDAWALSAYEDASRRAFRSYARLASWLVALARRPALRRAALNRLIARPELFGFLLRRLTAPR